LGEIGDSFAIDFFDGNGSFVQRYNGSVDDTGSINLGKVNIKSGLYNVVLSNSKVKLHPFKANIKPGKVFPKKTEKEVVSEEIVYVDLNKIKSLDSSKL